LLFEFCSEVFCYKHSDVSVHIRRQFFVISRTVNSRSL